MNQIFTYKKSLIVLFVLFQTFVFAQTAQISAGFCGSTLSSLGSNVTCDVNYGLGHRYEVSKLDGTVIGVYDAYAASQSISGRSAFLFRFNFMSECGVGYGSTYRVRAAWYNGTSWSSYGPYCNISTPTSTLQINNSFCGTIIASLGTNITCATNQMCGHRYEVRKTDGTLVGVYDAVAGATSFPGRSKYDFRFSWMPTGTIQNATTYRIKVACYDNTTGTWSAYGPSCDITTPSPTPTKLSTSWCNNVQIPATTTSITCDAVSGTYQYLFYIYDQSNTLLTTLTKTTNSFTMAEMPSPYPQACEQYNVIVRTKTSATSNLSVAGNTCTIALAAPSISVNPATICNGQSATLNAIVSQSGGTYAWSSGGNGQSETISPISTTSYTVSYTYQSCSAVTTNATVTVNSSPSVSVNDQTVCPGSSATLTATPLVAGGTYIWSTGETTQSISPSTSGTYTVSYSLNGCSPTTDSGILDIIAPYTVTIGDATICAGETVPLSANPSVGGGSYHWSTGATTPDIDVSTAGTYTVSYSVSGCSPATANSVVSVNAAPTVSINSITICTGETGFLAPNPSQVGGTYEWSTGATGATLPVTTGGIYTVTYTLGGCTPAIASAMVTENPAPTVSVNDVTICAGETSVITATPSQTGGSYSWSTGEVTQSINVNTAGSYTVTYLSGACSPATATATVTLNAAPTVSVNSLTLCSGETGTLTATPSQVGGTYVWSTGEITQSISVSAAGNYTVTYSYASCTQSNGTGSVVINPAPTVSVNSATVCTAHNATLTATPTQFGGTYLWSNGLSTQSITVSTAGTYTVTYTMGACTQATASGTLTVTTANTVSINSASICAGLSATLTASVNNAGGSYAWSTGATTASISVTPASNTTYSVTYTMSGCNNVTASRTVTVNSGCSTQLAAAYCGGQTVGLGTNLACTQNLGQGHRFEVYLSDGTYVGVYDAIAGNLTYPSRSKYILRLNYLPACNVGYGKSYKVRVAWYNGTSWSSYGNFCSINSSTSNIGVNPSFCGTTVANLGTNVTCISNQMCGHRFEVRLQNEALVGVYDAYNASLTYSGRSPFVFRFSYMPTGTISLGTWYRIRVAYYDGVTHSWSAYGNYCDIQTPNPPATQLTNSFCNNLSIPSSSTSIQCNAVTGTFEYRFTVSASGYGQISQIVKNTNSFTLGELPSPHPIQGLTYSVTVSTRQSVNATFSPEGSSCNVRIAIPTTTLSPNDCGRTINYLQQDTLHVLPLSGVSGYRYRIVEGSNTIVDTVMNLSTYTGITLRKFPGIQYCKTYAISVRTLMNGIWSDWGTPCSINTTCSPYTDLRPAYCGGSIESCGSNLYANSIVYGTPYQFKIVGGNINETYQPADGSPNFKFQQLASASQVTYGTTYAITCRVRVGGVWGPWGNTCNVTLSQANSRLTTYCNASVPTMSTNIYSSSIGCATDYKFKFNGPGLSNYEFNPPTFTNFFRLNQLTSAGLQFNGTYTVSVSTLVNGVWSPYGTSCTITTPAALMPNEPDQIDFIEDNSNNGELNGEEFAGINEQQLIASNVNIYPNPFNKSFLISIPSDWSNQVDISIVDASGSIVLRRTFSNPTEIEGLNFGEDLNRGVYFVIIENNEQSIRKKLIKAY